MDQRFRTAGSLTSAIILILVSLILFVLSAGMFATYPDTVWLVGFIFLASAGAILFSAVKSIITTNRENKEAVELQEHITAAARNAVTPGITSQQVQLTGTLPKSTISPNTSTLLGNWNYSIPEWEAFMRLETKSLRNNLLLQSLLIGVLGTVVVLFSTNATLPGAAAASIFTGAVYGLLKYNFHIHSIHHKGPGNPEVFILPDAFIINGHYNALKGENLWFENAVIKKEKACSILEITYGWSTRKGNTSDMLRVPIPTGKENEAVRIVKELKARHTGAEERKAV